MMVICGSLWPGYSDVFGIIVFPCIQILFYIIIILYYIITMDYKDVIQL